MTNYEELVDDLIDAVREDTDAYGWGTPRHGYDAQRQALLDAIPRWQPMDTAPKDGTAIVVREGDTANVVTWGEQLHRLTWLIANTYSDEYGLWRTVDAPDAWLPVADLLALPMR